MDVQVRVTAAFLVPLLALTPSCAATRPETGEQLVRVEGREGRPVDIPEAELWGAFRMAARGVAAKADPLAAAEQTFGLAEGTGTYRYYAPSGRLVPERGAEEVAGAAEKLTRDYREWCGGTRLGQGDCLHLLAHSPVLTMHGRYVVTLAMAMGASFGPMLDSLKELADPNAVAVMLASAVAIYLLLWLVPEPISKLISLSITGALIGYLGLDAFWSLVYGWRALAGEVDAATDFGQLRAAARAFGRVLGPQLGQLLILLVCHSLGQGLSAKGASLPRFAEASAQSERLLHARLGAAAAVRSVSIGSGVITISLATGATAVGTPGTSPGVFEGSPKHGSEPYGRAAAEPTNAQDVLDHSVQVKDSSPRRVGVDPKTGEYAVFDQHRPGVWHGHVRAWGELTDEMKNALARAGLTDRRGRILVAP